jgi:two-component system, cell cycle response regulator DivK
MQNSGTLLVHGPKNRILVAEDHGDSREALKFLLEAFGFEVIEAVNGKQAVDAATHLAPNLILMDMMMPEMDGFEAIRKLRATAATNQIPIIAVTAMEGARELALDAGANDYMGKPIDIRRLLVLLSGWVSHEPN